MNPDPNTLREFDLLLEKLCEQQISDADREQLENLLRQGNPWRQRYLDYIDLHAVLSLVSGDPFSLAGTRVPRAGTRRDSNQSAPIGEFPLTPLDGCGTPGHFATPPALNGFDSSLGGSPFAPASPGGAAGVWEWLQAPWIGIVAIVCFIAGGGAGILWVGGSAAPPPVSHVSATGVNVTPVAYLTSANGCAWGGNSVKTWTVGHSVESGSDITLHEGIAEFRLSNGVTLSLEGPASLILASPSTLVLRYGKLTMHVRWNVTEFKVIAGACQFTACDAEFGLLQTGSKVEVHVFSGAVHAESPHVVDETGGADFIDGGLLVINDAGEFTRGTITAGNALTLISEGNSLSVDGKVGQKAKPESFATKLSMAGPLPVTKDYVETVLASKPFGYWRFESLKDGKIKSEVAGGGDLTMLGDLRFTGQPGNYVAEYHPELVGRFRSKALNQLAGSDYSLEAWIKPSHAHRGNVLALTQHRSGKSHAAAVLSLFAGVDRRQNNPAGAIGMLHESFEDLGMPGSRKVACYSKRPYQARRWQHVVAVKKGSRLQLYVDGKLSNSVPDSTSLTTGFYLSVGRDPGSRECRFVGQLDEVAIYSRALTEQEILKHYEVIKATIDAPAGLKPVDARGRPNQSARSSPLPKPPFTPSLVNHVAGS